MRTRGYDSRYAGKPPENRRGPYPAEGEWPATVSDAYEADGYDQFVFEVEGPGKTVERKYRVFHDNESAQANAAEALAQPGDPDDMDPQETIGRRCRVVIKHAEDKKESGKWWANVDYLLPLTGGGTATAERRRDAGRGPSRDQRQDQRLDGGSRDGGSRDGHGARTYGGRDQGASRGGDGRPPF